MCDYPSQVISGAALLDLSHHMVESRHGHVHYEGPFWIVNLEDEATGDKHAASQKRCSRLSGAYLQVGLWPLEPMPATATICRLA